MNVGSIRLVHRIFPLNDFNSLLDFKAEIICLSSDLTQVRPLENVFDRSHHQIYSPQDLIWLDTLNYTFAPLNQVQVNLLR